MYMKVSIAVAAIAVLASCWSLQEQNGAGWPFAAAAFAVAVAGVGLGVWRAWRLALKMMRSLSTCAEKLTYMEHRMDKGHAHVGDICRHLKQVFAEFDLQLNQGNGDQKWWWVSRRVRDLYEALGGSLMEKNADMQAVEQIWGLINLEVYLRCCRDLVANRFCKVKSPADYDEVAEELFSHALQNIQPFGSLCRLMLWRNWSLQAHGLKC